MIMTAKGVVSALGPAGALLKDNWRAYGYMEVRTPEGALVKLDKFRVLGSVDHGLKEGVEGVFVFAKAFGHTRLVASQIAGVKRVISPLSRAFVQTYSGNIMFALFLMLSLIGIIGVPFVIFSSLVRLPLERAALKRVLKEQGFDA